MDATPFVTLVAGNTYGTKDDFLDAANSWGHMAEFFFSFPLSLRLNRNTRPTLKIFLRQLRLLRSGSAQLGDWFQRLKRLIICAV